MTTKKFQKIIWQYYQTHGREFPWRKTTDPYKILVSETMLQQTQTERVIPKYKLWLKLFPNFKALHRAPLQKVLKAWQGLGYNRRAIALKRTAEIIMKTYDGKFPKDLSKILSLPGIGPYTASAVSVFSFNMPLPCIETNIRTVYIHFFFKDSSRVSDKDLLRLIEQTLDRKNPREWFYALMDYGVWLKKTGLNRNSQSKHYTKQSPFKGSNRELRAKIVRLITEKPQTFASLKKSLQVNEENIKKNLKTLEKEGFFIAARDTHGRVCYGVR